MGVYNTDMECYNNASQRLRADFHTVRVAVNRWPLISIVWLTISKHGPNKNTQTFVAIDKYIRPDSIV